MGTYSRRAVLRLAGALPFGLAAGRAAAALTKSIPATGEQVPAIGMGSWITFNVGDDAELRADRLRVLQAFVDAGGALVDSSPMYGSSEDVIGHCLARLEGTPEVFTATKVWTPTRWLGIRQMETSERLWGVDRFDLLQIHNMVDWETHLETLLEWKAAGRVRYIGITTSHGRDHDAMERVMATEPFDFVQFSYDILEREVEQRLLPLAAERGIAVIVNRPFRRGILLERLAGHKLPDWAAEIGCATWPPFLLKFLVSHPAVTCAIPATSRVDHMQENMSALQGPMPDAALRPRMIEYVEGL